MGNVKPQVGDFPGPVVQDPPSAAVDADLLPGQGAKIPHAERQLSPGSTTREKPRDTTKTPAFHNQDRVHSRKQINILKGKKQSGTMGH